MLGGLRANSLRIQACKQSLWISPRSSVPAWNANRRRRRLASTQGATNLEQLYSTRHRVSTRSTAKDYKVARPTKVIHLNSSSGPGSIPAKITNAFLEQLTQSLQEQSSTPLTVEEVNLWDPELLRYDLDHVASKMRTNLGLSTSVDEKKLTPVYNMAQQLLNADVLVVSCPMWNWSMPYVLKQYIDCVIQPGITYGVELTSSTTTRQKLAKKPLILVTSAGGEARKDYLTPYILDIFGLVGYTDVENITALNTSTREREEVIATSCALAISAAERVACKVVGEGILSPNQQDLGGVVVNT